MAHIVSERIINKVASCKMQVSGFLLATGSLRLAILFCGFLDIILLSYGEHIIYKPVQDKA